MHLRSSILDSCNASEFSSIIFYFWCVMCLSFILRCVVSIIQYSSYESMLSFFISVSVLCAKLIVWFYRDKSWMERKLPACFLSHRICPTWNSVRDGSYLPLHNVPLIIRNIYLRRVFLRDVNCWAFQASVELLLTSGIVMYLFATCICHYIIDHLGY